MVMSTFIWIHLISVHNSFPKVSHPHSKTLKSSYCVCVKHDKGLLRSYRETRHNVSCYSSGTIISLAKSLTSYRSHSKLLFPVRSKMQLSSCFAAGQQFSLCRRVYKATFIFNNTMEMNRRHNARITIYAI